MLKITGASITSASRVDDNLVVGSDSIGAESDGNVSLSDALRKKSIKSKSWTKNWYLSNSNNIEEPKFLNSRAKKAFNCLKQAFTKVSILQYFDSEYYIRIKTDVLGYAIRWVLSQISSNQLTLDEMIKLSID